MLSECFSYFEIVLKPEDLFQLIDIDLMRSNTFFSVSYIAIAIATAGHGVKFTAR